jgi:hypothetical protein
MLAPFSTSLELKGFSLPSFGRNDSVDPLFLSDRDGGRSFSVNRASSICRFAICPLRSSRRAIQSGIDVHNVLRASRVEKFIAMVSGVGDVRQEGWNCQDVDRKRRDLLRDQKGTSNVDTAWDRR